MYFVVVIAALLIVGLCWFIFASAIQGVQESLNEGFASTNFITPGNWNVFDLANTFINNLWIFLLVFLCLGLGYYGYVEAQRRR